MPLITDWIMVGITAVYVIATIFIYIANNKSAKATREQVIESKRQFEETKRLEHMPYMQVDFDKWITSEERGTFLPDMWLNIGQISDQSPIASGMSIEVTNIGLGLADKLKCKWISEDIIENKNMSSKLLKQEESCKSTFIISADRKIEESRSAKAILVICFDDFLGNQYEQTVEVTFEIYDNSISLIYYNVKAPTFIE